MTQDASKIWKEYEKGQNYLNNFGYYTQIDESWRYYNGDQWNGLITPEKNRLHLIFCNR